MWYEILPSYCIIGIALSIPTFGMYGIHKLCLGNAYRRNLDAYFSRMMYKRDSRLTGNPYLINGLETIDDEK